MMPLNHISVVVFLGIAMAVMGAAHAQSQGSSPGASSTANPTPGKTQAQTAPAQGAALPGQPVASSDRDFLKDAAHAGAFEIEGSRIALRKAVSPDVKAFAQRMVDDHGKVAQQLDALARSKGVEVEDKPSLTQKAKLKTLEMRDDSFDKAYADEIGVSAHEEAVKLFDKAAREAKDPDVKSFAGEVLPQLQQHLSLAKTLKEKVDAAPASR